MKHFARPFIRLTALSAAAALALSGCSLDPADPAGTAESGKAGGTVKLVIGYQSKTINTVTAGTLLKAEGFLEKRLADLGKESGTKYQVEWQDYDTGAPITAQMVAEKIDIGSMGDYPLLINGSRTQRNPRSKTEFVSVTGYNPKGALNSVVVNLDSSDTSIADLAGRTVSASVGSAGHGTLVQALTRANVDPATGIEVLNQQPQVGAGALESGQVSALSQFVAWPGLLVFQNKAKLLYDGGELGVPTFHGVVARRDYAQQHPEVLDAFLGAQIDASEFIHEKPLEAAKIVADASGLPQEVVYLYNGPGGTSFDLTLKPKLIEAFKNDVSYLKSIGDFADLDIDGFINPEPVRKAFQEHGLDYDKSLANSANPTPGSGIELWFDGETETKSYTTADELLDAVKAAGSKKIRAAYAIDASTGTRWFADKQVWVRDGAKHLPFTTTEGARRYIAAHPGSVEQSYAEAVNS